MQVQTQKRPPMSQHPFTAFIDLVSLDQTIRSLHESKKNLQTETEVLLVQKQNLVDRLEQFKRHVHDLKKQVHEHEFSINEVDAKEKKKKEQLETVQSNKEYQLLKKEIDRLKQEQHDTESVLMEIWNKLEVAQKELKEQETSYDSKIAELHDAISKKKDEVASLEKQLTESKSLRPEKESGIPQEWLEKYTHMRMRVEDPVVQVMRGSCGACFYTIPDHEIIRLKRKALVQCKGCFRLLYMKDAMEETIDTTEKIPEEK